MTYLGYKIPVPPKRNTKKWLELREQILIRKSYTNKTESSILHEQLDACTEELKMLRKATPSSHRKSRVLELQNKRNRLKALIASPIE